MTPLSQIPHLPNDTASAPATFDVPLTKPEHFLRLYSPLMACKTASPSCEESDAALPASGMLTFANDDAEVTLLLQLSVSIRTNSPSVNLLNVQTMAFSSSTAFSVHSDFAGHQTVRYQFDRKHH